MPVRVGFMAYKVGTGFFSSTLVFPFSSVTPNLGYAYPQGYEPGQLGVREKNLIMAEKGTYVNSVRQDTSQML
jgi:hypothetical protein